MAAPTYDFIVIGSGAGGGPVAANLARAGHTVLVPEAGGDCHNFNYRVPCFHSLASEDPDMSWDFFVRHYDDEATQQRDSKFDAAHNGVLYPRAGTLGGCTAHNAMITVYPHNSDWEYIRELTGDESWSADNMRRYFERMENCHYESKFERFEEAVEGVLHHQGTNPARHGYSGWLRTEAAPATLALQDTELLSVVATAALDDLAPHLRDQPLELETFFDPNDWRMVTSQGREGVCMVPLATAHGCRNGTREHLLNTVKETSGKLTIQTGALASRILFDENKRAIGVEYLQGTQLYRASRTPQATEAATQTVYCNHEVILSGGVFNSPQLLMLSGIGDKAQLEALGIPVVADLPGVGRNMQDRYEVTVISKMARPFSLLDGATFVPPASDEAPCDPIFSQWKLGKGVYATNGACIAISKRSAPDKPDPDLFIFGIPSYFKGYYTGYSQALRQYQDIFTWAVLKAHTNNTAGRVTLRTTDPRDTPDIVFHYFGEGNDTSGDDLRAVVDGLKFVRRKNDRARQAVGIEEQTPGHAVATDEQLAAYVRDEAWGHHASCTNKIGTDDDPLAVLDSRFRVRGVTGLRVVDASVFPRIPGFFIVTAVYMIAEKASDAILEDLGNTRA